MNLAPAHSRTARQAISIRQTVKSPRARSAGEVFLLVIAAVAPYLLTLKSYFLGDDFGFIGLFHDQPLAHFLSLFANEWTNGIFGEQTDEVRPLTGLSYRIDALLGPTNPVGYHASNIAEHAACTLLVYAMVNLTAPHRPGIAFSAALLFAVLPVHSEAVSWISGRADTISTLVFLVTLVTYMVYRLRKQRRWYTLSLIFFLLALFAKESSIVVPLLIIGYDVLLSQPRERPIRSFINDAWLYMPYALMSLAYLALRWYVLGDALRESRLSVNLLQGFLARQRHYLWALLLPDDPFVFPKVAGGILSIVILVVAIASLLGFVLILKERESRGRNFRLLLYFGPLWYVVSVLPLIVTYFSPRHLYFASVGSSIALPLLWLIPARRSLRQVAITVVLLVLLLAMHTVELYRANSVWRAASAVSEKIARDFERAGALLPDSSRVVLTVPPGIYDTVLWAWALPYVFEEPFSSADLYTRLEIVDHPYSYCCRTLWAHNRLGLLEKWVSDPGGSEIHVLYWNDGGGGRLENWRLTITPDIAEQVSLLRRLLDIGDDRRVYGEMLDLFSMLSSNAR